MTSTGAIDTEAANAGLGLHTASYSGADFRWPKGKTITALVALAVAIWLIVAGHVVFALVLTGVFLLGKAFDFYQIVITTARNRTARLD